MNPSLAPLSLDDIITLVQSGCIYIYALLDPDTNIVRYIGKSKTLVKRLQQHLSESRNSRLKKHVHCWLTSLLRQNKQPRFAIIETLGPERTEEWEERERYWIARYRKEGHDLTNIADGGQAPPIGGRRGKKNSPEHTAKIRASRAGKPIRFKDRAKWEINHTAGIRAYYAKMQEAGIKIIRGPMSEETKRKIAEGNRGQRLGKPLTGQHLANVRAALKARPVKGRAVIQYDKDLNQIAVYPTIRAAAHAVGIKHTAISNVLAESAHTAGGFIWRYVPPVSPASGHPGVYQGMTGAAHSTL